VILYHRPQFTDNKSSLPLGYLLWFKNICIEDTIEDGGTTINRRPR